MNELSHLDRSGKARMVNVTEKGQTVRLAKAEGYVFVGSDIIRTIESGPTPKGNVFETARLAGIMAAKRTADMIPLCHTVPLTHVEIDFEVDEERIRIAATTRATGPTGVEMEALTAVAVAALTVYDMLKALSHGIRIISIRLLSKSGGSSGDFRVEDDQEA